MSDSPSTGGDRFSLDISLARETCLGCLGVWLPPSRWECVPSREDGGLTAVLPSIEEAVGMKPLPYRSSEGCFRTRVLDRLGVPRWAHLAAQTEQYEGSTATRGRHPGADTDVRATDNNDGDGRRAGGESAAGCPFEH